MPTSAEHHSASHQAQFHDRWNHLYDPHVRTLAWLLDAPDLLDPDAPEWRGRVATLGPVDAATRAWLAALDREPAELHAFLELNPFTRLGRYAEKLLAFYLGHREMLFAHGVQVRAAKNETIGEFDFLLRNGETLVHWEFATKLYLLESSGRGHQADYFVGPNLADSLGNKVRKIMERQLSLSDHPAASACLPLPVSAARALVKGWLFYHGHTPEPASPDGISPVHCRGFWCSVDELATLAAQAYLILPRLSWLAPARHAGTEVLEKNALAERLAAHFDGTNAPVLVALLEKQDGIWLEVDRGFVVPGDWSTRAGLRIRPPE